MWVDSDTKQILFNLYIWSGFELIMVVTCGAILIFDAVVYSNTNYFLKNILYSQWNFLRTQPNQRSSKYISEFSFRCQKALVVFLSRLPFSCKCLSYMFRFRANHHFDFLEIISSNCWEMFCFDFGEICNVAAKSKTSKADVTLRLRHQSPQLHVKSTKHLRIS